MTQTKRQQRLNFVTLVTIRVLLKIFLQNVIRNKTVPKREKHTVKLTKITSPWIPGRRGRAVKTFLMQWPSE